jgi:hypothetical protein
MGSKRKTKQNAAKNPVQASRGTAATARKGFKRAPRDLEEWIRLANLVQPGALPDRLDLFVPGTWPSILEKIAKLEDPLRSELLAHSKLSERWRSVAGDYDSDAQRVALTYGYFARIQTAATYVRLLARADAEATLDTLESFVSSLRYAELSYLRECPQCRKVFYAGRATQLGCTPAHSSAIRKKRKQERDKENRNLKKKRASKAGKR